MTKTYKLLIDSPEFPKGTMAVYKDEYLSKSTYSLNTYFTFLPGDSTESISKRCGVLRKEVVENRPEVWELQEEKLDLRSPEAEKIREEARSKRWEFVPNMSLGYYSFILGAKTTCSTYWDWDNDEVDLALWGMGNCHRTKEEALAWGEKYARYFLTE